MQVLNNLKIEPYGYSHGDKIGIKLFGIKAGYVIDFDKVDTLLNLRKGDKRFNTNRSEAEKYTVKSGIKSNLTTGDVIWIEIEQNNFKKSDYEFGVVRPGHADLSAYQKYGKNWNYSGGGQFSGRLTVLYVIVGEIARQILNTHTEIEVLAHVKRVTKLCDKFDELSELRSVQTDYLPIVSPSVKEEVEALLSQLKVDGESVGGKVDIYIDGLTKNYGDDFFEGLESKIAFLLFSIPAVKAVEFGIGVEFSQKMGSQVIEQLVAKDGMVKSKTNFNGGINGGIANLAAPIKMSVTIKPTSTSFKEIRSVKYNGHDFEPTTLKMKGRHDTFIANRAIWPLKGLMYILLLDLEME